MLVPGLQALFRRSLDEADSYFWYTRGCRARLFHKAQRRRIVYRIHTYVHIHVWIPLYVELNYRIRLMNNNFPPCIPNLSYDTNIIARDFLYFSDSCLRFGKFDRK